MSIGIWIGICFVFFWVGFVLSGVLGASESEDYSAGFAAGRASEDLEWQLEEIENGRKSP